MNADAGLHKEKLAKLTFKLDQDDWGMSERRALSLVGSTNDGTYEEDELRE